MSAPQWAIFACGLLIIAAICAGYIMAAVRDALDEDPAGRHARAEDAEREAAEFIADLRREYMRPAVVALPVAGELPMLPPDPPPPGPADTQPIPHAVGTWGRSAHDLADELARAYLEVTR